MFLQVYGSPPPAQSPVRLLREEGFAAQGSCSSILLHAGPSGCNSSQHPGDWETASPAQITALPAALQLNLAGVENMFFWCLSWAKHFFPTKGRGNVQMPDLLLSHRLSTPLSRYLRCFIHKPPTACC